MRLSQRFDRLDIAIVLLSVLMIVAMNFLPFKAKPYGDRFFHEEAKVIAQCVKGVESWDKAVLTKAPGPSLFFSFAYMFAPSDATDGTLWRFGVFANSVLLVISLLLIYRAATALFSRRIGFLSIFLALIFPLHCYYVPSISSELLAFFCSSMAFYGWSVAYARPNKKRGYFWLVAGLCCLALCRPNTLLLPLLGFVVVGFAFFRSKAFYAAYGKNIAYSMAAVIAFGLACTQGVNMFNKGKDVTDQGVYFFYVAHQGRFQFRNEPFDWRYWQEDTRPDSKDYWEWRKAGDEIREYARTAKLNLKVLYMDFLIEDAREHPFLVARSFVIKGLYSNVFLVNSVDPEDFKLGFLRGRAGFWALMSVINFVNMLMVAGSLVFLVTCARRIDYWPLWGIWAALLVFHGLTYMEPRYLFPARPAFFILSAAGLYHVRFLRTAVNWMYARFFGSNA